jgi:hypothetical protein
MNMEDTETLSQFLAKIKSFSLAGPHSLGGLAHDLETLFERLQKRSARLDRAYKDFWSAAEVIFVSCVDEKRDLRKQEGDDAMRLLVNLEHAVKDEILSADDY